MNAIVLAGGCGSRLKPLTNNTPKPMLVAANRPIVDYCVAQLYHYGIRDIVFTLGYLPEQIVEWAIGYTGISTHFCVEEQPLGTLGGVKAASDFLQDTFIVLSGDGISDINLNALLNRHLANRSLVTAAVKKVDDPSLYGIAQLGKNGLIEGFVEKPHSINQPSYVNCGTYAVSKSALSLIDAHKCDFALDLFPLLVQQKKLGYYEHKGYWQDIGDIKSFYDTNFDMLKRIGDGTESGGFFASVKNFNDDKYASKLVGGMTPSLVNGSARVAGRINECIVGEGADVAQSAVLDRCIVVENGQAHGRCSGCIIGADFSIKPCSGEALQEGGVVVLQKGESVF